MSYNMVQPSRRPPHVCRARMRRSGRRVQSCCGPRSSTRRWGTWGEFVGGRLSCMHGACAACKRPHVKVGM